MKRFRIIWTVLTAVVLILAAWTNYLCWGERLLTVSTGLGSFAASTYRPFLIAAAVMLAVTAVLWAVRRKK